jgi:hypothetical protein
VFAVTVLPLPPLPPPPPPPQDTRDEETNATIRDNVNIKTSDLFIVLHPLSLKFSLEIITHRVVRRIISSLFS